MKLRKRLASLLLSAALIAGLLPAVTPQAQATESASDRQGAQFGYSGMQDGDHVLFGYADEASTYPISWKILDNDADNCGKSGAMLLFSDEVLGTSVFSHDELVMGWYDFSDCKALQWCVSFMENSAHFDEKWMQGRMRAVDKTGESDSWSDDGAYWSGKATKILSFNAFVNGSEPRLEWAKMFCLSLLEARKYLKAEDYAAFRYDTKEESSWWLRNNSSYYRDGGSWVCYGLQYNASTKRTKAEWYSVTNGMRPAFNFELPGNYSVTDYQSYGGQILLTVADETVKNPEGRMYAVPEYAAGEDVTWSMVVRDPNGHDNLQVMVNAPDGYTELTAGEGVLTGQVTYPSHVWGSTDGIESTENEYLTAVMVDSTGKIAFTGTVGKMLYPTIGGFNIPIPTGAEGTYKVYIFNEHNDGTGGVRYASEVKHVATINVTADSTKPVLTVKSYQREGDYSARITAQSDKDGTLFCSVNGQTESVRCYKNTPVEFRLENRLLPGTQTIEVWAKDAAGNESAKQTITFESYTAPVRASVMAGTSALRNWNSVDGYDYLYLGTNRSGDTEEPRAPTKWKVLDAAETNTGIRDGLFILADKVPAAQHLEHPVFGAGAGAKVLLTTQRNQLTQQEQDSLLATDLPWKKITTEDGLTLTDPVLSGQKLFLLSAGEAANSRYGFVSNDSRGAVINLATYSDPCPWALRSTGTGKIQNKSYEVSAIVTENGAVTTWDKMTDVLKQAGSSKIANYTFIRPAANLDKSRVLMTSNKDGKSDEVDSALTAPADYEGAEWKLTLIDSGRTDFAAAADKSEVAAGETISVTYSGAWTGENEYVSAMLLNSEGELLRYGRLANKSAGGTVSVTVPEELTVGTYTLKVFNEQINSGWAADYASAPVSIALTVSEEKLAPEAPTAKLGENEDLISGAAVVEKTGDQTMTLSTTSAGAKIWYTLTTQVDGGESYISEPQQYANGISLAARGSAATYTVKAWTEQYGKKSAEQTFAVKVKSAMFTLTVIAGDLARTEHSTYRAGDKVTISAPEFDDQIFVSWFLESGTISGFDSQKQNKTITFTMPDSDVTLRVDYVPKIAKIELTMAAPTAGAALPGAITSYELKSAKGTVITSASAGNQPSIIWTVDKDQVSGTAGYGMTYTANITLYPKETAKLAFLNSVTATVNGENATVLYNSADGSVIVRASFRTGNATLNRVVQPAGLSVPYGTNAAIIQRGLPAQAELETDAGVRYGTIEWETIPEITQKKDGSQQTISVKGTVTLPAGVDNPTSISTIVNLTVTIEASTKAAAPTVDVTPGNYTANQTVKLLSVPRAEIRYYMTSDGSEPAVPSASAGEVYSTPLSLTGRAGETVTYKIKALVVSAPDRTQPSDVATFEYKITLPAMRTVTVNCLDTYTGSTVSTYTFRYAQGATATISAPPVGNAMFAGWTVDEPYITAANKNNGVITFTMPNEDVTLKANYAPVIRALTVTMAPPEAGQPLAATVTSCMADQHDITVYMKRIDWTPAVVNGGAAYNTSYTAAIAVDSDNSAVQSAKFVFADNVAVTVNGQSAKLDRDTMTIYYTFPSTSAAKLLSVTAPAGPVNLANGISKADIEALLPTKTAIAVEGGSANSAAIVWEDFAYDPDSLDAQTFTVNGTVRVPGFVMIPPEISTAVSVTVNVAAAPQAPMPSASVTPGSYNETKTVALSDASGSVDIYYTTNNSTPTASSTKYTTPIVLEGGNQSENTTTIKAIAIPKSGVRMRSSAEATYEYIIAARYPVSVNGETPKYYYAGENVSVTTPTVAGKQFLNWDESTLPAGAVVEGDTVTFTMPSRAVTLTARYAGVISAVQMTISAPMGGSALDDKASTTFLTATGKQSTELAISWNPTTARAAFGTTYTAAVELTAPDGYVFSDALYVTVNDAAARIQRLNDRKLYAYQEFSTAGAKLLSIPEATLTGVASHTALADMALPERIPIVTEDSGVTSAAVTWNRTSSAYDPGSTAEQTFTLSGTVALPDGIDQNSVPLTASLKVTVAKADQVAAPVADLPSGSTFIEGKTLNLSCATAGATIRYTVNGGAEQAYSPGIALALPVREDTVYTITAWAVKDGLIDSAKVTFTYKVLAPTYTVTVVDSDGQPSGTGGGTYHAGDIVTISTPATGSTRVFQNWTVTAGEATLANANAATTTFPMPAGNVTVQANFLNAVAKVELNFAAPTGGTALAGKTGYTLYAYTYNKATQQYELTAGRTGTASDTNAPAPVISWTPAEGTAGYNKPYTASVTLLPNTSGENKIIFAERVTAVVKDGDQTVKATCVKNADGSVTITCAFPATAKATLSSITAPAAISVTEGTEIAQILPMLPIQVSIVTDAGASAADVIWGNYTASADGKTITITGAVILPEWVKAGSVPLTVTQTVNVLDRAKPQAPTASLASGTYTENKTVTLTAAGSISYHVSETKIDNPENISTWSTYRGAISLTGSAGTPKTFYVYAKAKEAESKAESTVVSFVYTISLPAPKYTVTVVNGTGSGSYEAGKTATIMAAAREGMVFTDWTTTAETRLIGDNTKPVTTFTVPKSNATVTANYKTAVTSVNLTVTPPKAGEALPSTATPLNPKLSVSEFSVKKDMEEKKGTAEYNTTYTITAKVSVNDESYVFANPAFLINGDAATAAANGDGSYTVTYTYKTDKAKLLGVTNPDGLTGITNGTAMADIIARLPANVNVSVEGSSETVSVPVIWDPAPISGSYDPSSKAAQSYTLRGILSLPDSVGNLDGLYAQVSVSVSAGYSGGGSSSGGGGGSGSTEVTVPVSSGDQSYQMPVTESNGTVTMKDVDQTKLDAFFTTMDNVDTLTIDFSNVKQNVTSAKIPTQILSAAAKALEEKGAADAGMSIVLPKGSAEFDAAAAKSVAGQAGDRIQLNITDVSLNNAQKTALKDMTTYGGITVTLTSNGKTISTFDGGTVLLKIPFTVPADQKAGGFSIWYVPKNGAPEKLSTTYRNGNLEVRVSHFSEYVIAYDEADAVGYANCGRDAACPLSAYADLNSAAWYHDGVHYCLNTGLMNGVGDGKFNPTGTTSRAMVVTMLWRMADSPKATENSTFTDVPTGTWYTEAAAWGAENGIINGYNGAFDPGGAITREQLAAMLYRYAKTQGKGFTGAWMMQLDYPDAGSVSDWAYEAMCWMTMNGVINGKDGKLVPTGAASRAEAAVMLQRFTESMQ